MLDRIFQDFLGGGGCSALSSCRVDEIVLIDCPPEVKTSFGMSCSNPFSRSNRLTMPTINAGAGKAR